MADSGEQQPVYVLGHSPGELKRLTDQARFFEDLTEQVFARADIRAGMHVLDVGCGAGDVSFLLARMVGAAGSVIGIDRSTEAVATASERARQMGLRQVRFSQGNIEEISLDQPVDAAVGRFVLMYSNEPSVLLRRVAANVKPGGIVAFQEMNVDRVQSFPPAKLFDQTVARIIETFNRGKVETRMGLKLYQTFIEAGLPPPQMILGARVEAGPDSLGYEHLAGVARSLLSMMEKFGVAKIDDIQIETLASRLRDEVSSGGGVIVLPSLVGAWARTTGTATVR
jgi:ubiquinone/menaquinone biosynthesis C-methylase UbiE